MGNHSNQNLHGKCLKRLRVCLALVFLACTGLLFVDIHGAVPTWVFSVGTSFQFLPSLVKGIHAFGWGALGFLIVLLATLLFGRVYCSVVCPLGISMDLVGAAHRKSKISRKREFVPSRPWVRYPILVATILALASGSMIVINILDPFSNFGRMATAIIRPLVIVGNNAISYLLEIAGYYALAPYTFKWVGAGMLAYSCAFGVLIVWLAMKRDRFYCNTICPVGTFLGLFSKASVYQVRMDQGSCIGCGKCEKTCKSECIDIDEKQVDFSRCVACFNCLSQCPTDAITYSRAPMGHAGPMPQDSSARRRFLVFLGLSLTMAPTVGQAETKIKVTVPNKIMIPKPLHPILPPGALGLNRFIQTCTACHACVAACPSQVLQPSMAGYGLAGLFMPHLDPNAGFCNVNCTICGQVCPSGAITSFFMEEKKQIQVGVAKFVRNNCIVILQGTACGACSEHCPTKAVRMVAEGKLMVPAMTEDICLGCGACEHVCPAKPNKAIYVNPHAIHQTAKLPVSDGKVSPVQSGGLEEFPF